MNGLDGCDLDFGLGDTLDAGQYGILIVALNPQGTDVGALLTNAQSKHVVDGVDDSDGAIEAAFEYAGA